MERLRSAMTHAPDAIDSAVVAILPIDPEHRHVGLVHRDVLKHLRLLELRWDFDLADDLWNPGGYSWVVPNLDPFEMEYLEAKARQVWRGNEYEVPYGFSHPSNCFDEETARFLFGTSRVGLTCASLVLAVFHFADFPLIEYESWENRPDDAEWQVYMCEQMEARGASDAEINARRRAEVGSFRYRPEEVAAASMEYSPPVTFAVAQKLGEEIVIELNQRRHDTPGP